MEETIKLEVTKAEAEQFQSLIEQCLMAMQKAQAEISRDEVEFQRLKSETEAIIARLGKGALNVPFETNL